MKTVTGVAIHFGALPPHTAGMDVVLTDEHGSQTVEHRSLLELPKGLIEQIRDVVTERAPMAARWESGDAERPG